MKKTATKVELDVYNLIEASTLMDSLSGGAYLSGTRPKNSKLEDVVIIFLTGTDGDIQEGVVNVNAFVNNIDFNGSKTKDSQRCEALEGLLNDFVNSNGMSENYLFELKGMIQTFEAPDINQHFVNAKLKFRYITI